MQGKKEKRKKLILCLIFALTPLLAVILRTALDGKTVFNISLEASEWNDELFYFKQVEAMVKYGVPQGYFGFNESHAELLSFAAWSPVLLMPWTIWGVLFGWHLSSPIWCNIILFSIAMFVFAWLSEPKTWQTICTSVTLIMFFPFARYLLSGMPEVIVTANVVALLGMFKGNILVPRKGLRVGMYMLACVLTLMRPYLILFSCFPIYSSLKVNKKNWKLPVIFVVATFGVYVLVNKLLAAPYTSDLFYTDWIKVYFTDGFGKGLSNTFSIFYDKGIEFFYMMVHAFSNGNPPGAYLGIYLTLSLLLFVQAIISIIRKKPDDIFKYFALVLIQAIFMVAILLMYKLVEGSKHLLTFVMTDILVLGFADGIGWMYAIVASIVSWWLFWIRGYSDYEYGLNYKNDETAAVDALRDELAGKMTLQDGISFDNVVIWAYNDYLSADDENKSMTAWQYGYAIPTGFGINMCEYDYLIENISSIQSRYILLPSNGSLAQMIKEAGATYISGDETMSVYELKK